MFNRRCIITNLCIYMQPNPFLFFFKYPPPPQKKYPPWLKTYNWSEGRLVFVYQKYKFSYSLPSPLWVPDEFLYFYIIVIYCALIYIYYSNPWYYCICIYEILKQDTHCVHVNCLLKTLLRWLGPHFGLGE